MQNRAAHNLKHISPTPQSLRASSPYTGEPLVECEHRLKPKDSANKDTFSSIFSLCLDTSAIV